MCTMMFYRETLPAEKRRREDSQKAVDRLMEYDRRLSEPFTREELKEIFSGESRHIGELGEIHTLLADDEKRIVAELGLTPKTPPEPVDLPNANELRRCLKAEHVAAPAFDDHPFGTASGGLWGGADIYVWLDNCGFGNSDRKGFYYVRYQLSMLAWGSMAYAHPALIVQKNQLRPDQIEYMERKCRETLAAARRKNSRRED